MGTPTGLVGMTQHIAALGFATETGVGSPECGLREPIPPDPNFLNQIETKVW